MGFLTPCECVCVSDTEMIATSFQLLDLSYWREAECVVPQAALMENEPPGFFFALARGDMEDPQMV